MEQSFVMTCTTAEAPALLGLAKARGRLANYGVEAYTVEATHPLCCPKTGDPLPSVDLMVRAETTMQAGIGKGYLLALADELDFRAVAKRLAV